MDIINEYHKAAVYKRYGNKVDAFYVIPVIVLEDGFMFSVQASRGHFCEPALNRAWPYSSWEIMIQGEVDAMLDEYDHGGKDDVYARVPTELVLRVIDSHGGIKT